MKKVISLFLLLIFYAQSAYAFNFAWINDDEKAVEKVLKAQVKYANLMDFKNFIKTYDAKYLNSDGFNLDIYSSLIKDVWKTFDNIKYSIDIKNIEVKDNKAVVELVETSFAEIELTKAYEGELKSEANSIYYLEKIDNIWKVVSDEVIDETTSMLYGSAKNLDIKLTVPNKVEPDKDYCATLEFEPPQKTIAIASIASDIVEYPQKPTKEVFRALPDDNILERLFTSNNKNANEYVVASIGLTQADINNSNMNIKLTGFGYAIKRVNIIREFKEGIND